MLPFSNVENRHEIMGVFCIQEDETILHILWSRPKVQDLLSSFQNHCENNDLHFIMDGGSFILGYMLQLPNEHTFVCIKLYIYIKTLC